MQWWAARAWPKPHSTSTNFISDLGDTACGNLPVIMARYVCSPDHNLMNISFIALGVTMALGAILLRPRLMPSAGRSQAPISTPMEPALPSFSSLFMGLAIRQKKPKAGFGKANIMAVLLILLLSIVDDLSVTLDRPLLTLSLGHGGIERLCSVPAYGWLILVGLLLLSMTFDNTTISHQGPHHAA